MFKCPKVAYNRDTVDDHNSKRMDLIAIEEMWKMMQWPVHVFQFLFAMMEVIVHAVATALCCHKFISGLGFCRKLAEKLNNDHCREEEQCKTMPQSAGKKRLLHVWSACTHSGCGMEAL